MAKDDPAQYSKVVTTDKTQGNAVIKDQKTISHLKKNDIALLPSTSKVDSTGFIKHSYDSVPATKKMFAAVSEMNCAYDPALTFTIRGNLDLLLAGVIYPTGLEEKRDPVSVTSPKWIKVNIKDQDGEPFFYTGKYQLISIENYFSGGKFTQNLSVIMQTNKEETETTVPMQAGGGY
jgi:hypothetical protein